MVASKSMTTEDFAQLRKEAQEAKHNLKFLTEEADAYFGDTAEATAQKQLQESCKRVREGSRLKYLIGATSYTTTSECTLFPRVCQKTR